MDLILKNKRGMFFTLIAVTLLSLFLLSLAVFSETRERESTNKRIETMNNYVLSLEEDFPRKLFISGFRIIFLFEKRILENGTYISNVSSVFNETFFDGTIEGTMSAEEISLISGVRFEDILDDLNTKADKLNLDISFSNPEIFITQVDPWNLKLSLTGDLFIADEAGLATWNRSEVIEAYLPINNFEDPLYLGNTNGQINHLMRQTPYTTFITGGDISNLKSHVQGAYYIASADAPSFIDRLEGNPGPNVYGVESLVNLQKFAFQGLPIHDKSAVDHIYFSDLNPTNYNIEGMEIWFKLDDAHLATYNATGLQY